MENQNVQDFVESLSAVINEIQAKINGLSDVTKTLSDHLENQEANIEDYAIRSNEVFSSVSQLTENVRLKVEELKTTFDSLCDKQRDNEQAIDSLINLNKETLERVTEDMSTMANSFHSLLQSTTEQSLDYLKQNEISLKEWQRRSEDLLKNMNTMLVGLDINIKTELKQASEIMSKNLDSILRKLLEALSATNIQINKSKRVMLLMSILAGLAVISSLVVPLIR